MKNDCIFYIKGECRALKDMFCKNEECKFYKSKMHYVYQYNKQLKVYEVIKVSDRMGK